MCIRDSISYRGIFSAEFKYDARDRQFKLIEINARPWWYVEFAALCGVDVCRLAYQDATGRTVSQIGDYTIGRRGGILLHDLRAWKAAGSQHASLPSMFKTWAAALSTPFHTNDPLPGLFYFLDSLNPAPIRQESRQASAPQDVPEESQVRLTAAGK